MSILKVTAEEFHRKLVALIFDSMLGAKWDTSHEIDVAIEAFIKENVELLPSGKRPFSGAMANRVIEEQVKRITELESKLAGKWPTS